MIRGDALKLETERRSEIGAMRRRRTLEKILTGTVKALEHQNFENLAVEDVLVSASVSRGTFYTFFKDKADLSGAIAKLLNMVVEEAYDRSVPNKLDAVGHISFGAALYMDFAARTPNIARVMLTEFLKRAPDHSPFAEETSVRFTSFLEQGVREESLIIPSPEIVLILQSGALASMIGRIIEAPDNQKEAMIKSSIFHLLLMLGVAARDAEAHANRAAAKLPIADVGLVREMTGRLAYRSIAVS